jgi:transcriptional regulator with XRE-family HTH domain
MPVSLNDHVTAEIRAELGRQHRSAASLAAELGWTPPYLNRRMTGQIALDLLDLEAIADCLRVTLAKLMPAEVAS